MYMQHMYIKSLNPILDIQKKKEKKEESLAFALKAPLAASRLHREALLALTVFSL